MSKEDERSLRHDDESLKPDRTIRYEKIPSWVSTPEERAQEGVSPGTREASQVIDPGSGESESHSAPSEARDASPSSSAYHSVNSVVQETSVHPGMIAAPAAAVAPSYDYHLNERHDLYQRNQYSDYYLWDDFWLSDDYYYHHNYYHEDRYPHLYYDNYYGSDAHQSSYSVPSHPYVETSLRHGTLDYIDRQLENAQSLERVQANLETPFEPAQINNQHASAEPIAHSHAAAEQSYPTYLEVVPDSLVTSSAASSITTFHGVQEPSLPKVIQHSDDYVSPLTHSEPQVQEHLNVESKVAGYQPYGERMPTSAVLAETTNETSVMANAPDSYLSRDQSSLVYASGIPAIQCIDQPSQLLETQHSQGLMAPLSQLAEERNSALVYSQPYYVNKQDYRVTEAPASSLHSERTASSHVANPKARVVDSQAHSAHSEAPVHAVATSAVGTVEATSYLETTGFSNLPNHSEGLLSEPSAGDHDVLAPIEAESSLYAPQAETVLSGNVLHLIQNQHSELERFSHEARSTSSLSAGAIAGADGRSSACVRDEIPAKRLTINRDQGIHDGIESTQTRDVDAQLVTEKTILSGEKEGVLAHIAYLDKQEPPASNAPMLPALQSKGSETRGAHDHDLNRLLVTADSKTTQVRDALLSPQKSTGSAEKSDPLLEDSSASALLLNHPKGGNGSGPHGRESNERFEKTRAVAGAITLGTLGFAGKAAKTGAKKTAGALDFAATQLMREDEDLTKVADLDDIVHDGIDYMHRHAPASSNGSLVDQLISKELSKEGAFTRNERRSELRLKGEAPAKVFLAGGSTGESAETFLSMKKTSVREMPEAVNAGGLLAARKTGGTVSSKTDLLEKGPTGLKAVAAKASDHQGAEKHLLEKGDGKEGASKKKPATERERAIEKKKAERKAARKEKNESRAMSVVKSGGNVGIKGALLVGGMATSSTKKALASRNEEIAVAFSTVDKTKKTVRGAKTLVKLPFTIYHRVRQAITAIINTIKHLFNFAATLTSLGPVGAVIAMALFFLIIVVIVVLFATASIINDEQEVSEVSALVAELDADLTEDINALGDQPILYLDASDTYSMKGSDGKSLTKDADLADQESDLKEVVASSVTVSTDPSEVAAYIDAKYSGQWQVGAASWKYTIDAFGETWNVIEWDDMPEWAWKGLNKVNRGDFEHALTEELTTLLVDEFDLDESLAETIANDTADEFADVIYTNQIQGINEEVLMQIIKDCVSEHKGDLDLTNDQTRKLYYQMQQVVSDLIGEEDPFAFVYDEIVLLHERMNYWSEEYDSFEGESAAGGVAGNTGIALGTGSGGSNAYGYPNSSGYDPRMLPEWDGYNEVSVYGISEAGTTAVTADGTRITNTWADTNMGIACEGLQNYVFAYWSTDYKNATGISNGEPVKITLYNPATGLSVTAEVIDCGGWRGFNPRYTGLNADRQWDLLPAVWKALGGGERAGTMKVYWKVDPNAVVGTAAAEPKTIEDYPWPKETDEKDGIITITRPTLIVHGIQDALNNNPLMEEIIDKDSFETAAEYKAVRTFVVTKVKDVMKTLLTMENSEGETYVDYNYIRRYLGDPFGDDNNGDPREWVITHRFNPGYEDFDEEKAYVEVKPLDDVKTVRGILEGKVEEVDDGTVVIRSYIDTANSSEVVYSKLTDIKVEEGDEIKEGQAIGKMADDVLRISYYEINDAALQVETKKDWAYDPGLYMIGFAGYEDPSEPEEYIGPTSDYSGCQTVVEFAYSRLGCPYVWGATGPNTFDCSGLTQWCYAKAGIIIPRNSEAQHDAAAAAGNIIPLSKLQPGDILWKPGHVGIYIGNNQYIHAPRTGDVVKVSGNATGYFVCGLRFS